MRNQIFLLMAAMALTFVSCKKDKVEKSDTKDVPDRNRRVPKVEVTNAYAVDFNGNTWKSLDFDVFQNENINLKQVSSAYHAAWGITSSGSIYKYSWPGGWTFVNHSSNRYITAGGRNAENIYCLDNNNRLTKYNSPGLWSYPKWGYKLLNVEADPDGDGLWGININNQVVRSNDKGKNWIVIGSPVTMKQITSKGPTWTSAISVDNRVWHYFNGVWTQPHPDASLIQISCNDFADCYGVNDAGDVYYLRNKSNATWTLQFAGFSQFKWVSSGIH